MTSRAVPNPGKTKDMVVTMGYQGEHGQSGGRPPEPYEPGAYGPATGAGATEPQDAAEQPAPPATPVYDAVYDAESGADYAGDYLSGGRPGRRGPVPPRRRNTPLLVGGAVVALVVLVGAGMGLSRAMGGDEPAPAGATGEAAPGTQSPSPRPSGSPLPTGPLGAMLKSRSTDPRPLTLREVFRRKRFTAGGVRYVMTTWQTTRSCPKTMNGARLVSAVRRGGCTQVLRGTFARADGKLAGTIGIANLRTDRAATATANLANATKDAYLQPLPGGGVTKTLGNGIAYASAEARGHYVIFSWIQAPNGRTIPRANRKAAAAFGPHVVYGSRLGFALQYRGIAGKPYGR
jgi:hypothetical protein